MVRSFGLKRTPNLFLRKHRKWPLSPYKSKWQKTFDENQAMQSLKQATKQQLQNPDPPLLLSSLTNSFAAYDLEPTPQAYHFVITTLSHSLQFRHIPSVLDRLERVEKFPTPEYVFADLIKTYGAANNVQDAVDLFCRMPKFRCVPSVHSLNALLSVLCRNELGLKLVPEILLQSQAMNIRVEESSFKILVCALCRLNKVAYAIEILNCMIKDGFAIDDEIFSCILSSVCMQRDLGNLDIMGFWEELRKLGFCPRTGDYVNVMRFLSKGGRVMDAFDVLNQMKSDGVKPDIVCYNIVLGGIIGEGNFEAADDVFDELLVLGLVPDVHTYNAYIDGLCKRNNIEQGIRLITCMEKLGCKLNVITYNVLLEALCNVGDMSKMRELVEEMKVKGIKPNLQTYRVTIDALASKGEIFEACALMEEVLDKFFCGQCFTLDNIISGLCQRGLVGKALELLNKMADKRVSPGAGVWNALLSTGYKLDFDETTFIDLVGPV
ncbi:hypothetical protein SLEP1_g31988 [Rubroshorea leprosula]|uniref:Pentatricopeptide repeat-containing protein n=1 Tax=Rubroshorea leprosula TaxID=152421 RepID=A0AAV5KBW6_9ROSI|nr:hypothetical protein SLEP1_g31988 [Rubroshorea leprosula]